MLLPIATIYVYGCHPLDNAFMGLCLVFLRGCLWHPSLDALELCIHLKESFGRVLMFMGPQMADNHTALHKV